MKIKNLKKKFKKENFLRKKLDFSFSFENKPFQE